MKHQHLMPFGTQVLEDGLVCFRLWAPGCEKVSVCLNMGSDALQLPMTMEAGGWFQCETDRAVPGTRYRFRVADDLLVPDPTSRFNPNDVHGPSEVVAPQAFPWTDTHWRGRPWEDVVLYELHVGAFTAEGTFKAIKERLDYLVELGITAIELMPIADFPGERNWGYDGVLLFAPDSRYGRPEDLKDLVQSAHEKGLMIFLDVVYNHFGPEGNYLHAYAPAFFKDQHTPWGAAINYDGQDSRTVREFFIHNALYWLEEYRFDGLRLDAVHWILDGSKPHILQELAERVADTIGRDRHVHLVLENDANEAHLLGPGRYRAQWNDDFHHALHVLLSGEHDDDFSEQPLQLLVRCLTEGFAYQGEVSKHRDGARRGTPSTDLPLTAFVSLLQNHDQVGNRAFGERIAELVPPRPLRAGMAVMLLAPAVPLLFMGEEYGELNRFTFFCDFGPELARAVTEGRRREFSRFPAFNDPEAQRRIPDPSLPDTYRGSKLDWRRLDIPDHAAWLEYYRGLLRLRREHIMPRLAGMGAGNSRVELLGEQAAAIEWRMSDGCTLQLLANLGPDAVHLARVPRWPVLFASDADIVPTLEIGTLPPWSAVWYLENKNE